MMRDTEPPPVADEAAAEDRLRRETAGTRAAKRSMYVAAASFLAALAMAIPALLVNCQTQGQIGRMQGQVGSTENKVDLAASTATAGRIVSESNARQLQEIRDQHRQERKVWRTAMVDLAKTCGMSPKAIRALKAKVADDSDEPEEEP